MGGPRDRLARLSDQVLAVVTNLVGFCLSPGIVVHELSHAATCRLVGVEVTDVTLFQLPKRLTERQVYGGYVRHESVESLWRSAVISTAPLVTNTLGALGAFTLVRWLLAGRLGSPLGPPIETYVAWAGLSTAEQLFAVLAGWLGAALAFTGFPSREDLQNVGRYVESLRGRVEDGSARWYALQYLRRELAALYTLAVSLVGLFGDERGVSILLAEYAEFLVIGLLLFLAFILRNEVTSSGHVAPDNRTRRIASKAAREIHVDGDDIAFLVDRLDSPARFARATTAQTLADVAIVQPEDVTQWLPYIMDRAEAESSPPVTKWLLRTLYRVEDELDRHERLAALAVDALTSEEAELVEEAPQLLSRVALAEPALLAEHVGVMCDALDEVPPANRANLLLALSRTLGGTLSDPAETIEDDGSDPFDPRERVLRTIPADRRDPMAAIFERLDDEPKVRRMALRCIGLFGRDYPPARQPVVAFLRPYLDHDDTEFRAGAAVSLLRIAGEDPTAVVPVCDVLVASMTDEDETVRHNATDALVRVADSEPAALGEYVGPLQTRLGDSHAKTRSSAAIGLGRLAGAHSDAVAATVADLVDCLDDEDRQVRANATWALWQLAEVNPEVLTEYHERFCTQLTTLDPSIRLKTLNVLRELATVDPEIVCACRDTLVALLGTNHAGVRSKAASVLFRLADAVHTELEPKTEQLVGHVVEPNPIARGKVLGILANVADGAPTTVAAHAAVLRPHIRDPHTAARVNTAALLANIAEVAPDVVRPALDELRNAVDADHEVFRKNATEVLAIFSEDEPERVVGVLDRLVDRLDEDDPDTRANAARAIAGVAAAYPTLVACHTEALLRALDDEDERVRTAICRSLAVTAEPSVPDGESIE